MKFCKNGKKGGGTHTISVIKTYYKVVVIKRVCY